MFPIDNATVINIVAFVTDRSRDASEQAWIGPWVKPASHEQMLGDYVGWDPRLHSILTVCLLS
jgi:salicylate hydroxylase